MAHLKGVARDAYRVLERMAQERGCEIESEAQENGHVRVRFSRNGQSRFIVLPSSTKNYRTIDNAKRDAREQFKILGWEPIEMQRPSTGAAGPAIRIDPRDNKLIRPPQPEANGHVTETETAMAAALREAEEKRLASLPKLHGVPILDIPQCARSPYDRSGEAGYKEAYRQWIDDRTVWAEKAIAAGAQTKEVAEFLTKHGAPTASQTISQNRPGGARKRDEHQVLPTVHVEVPPPEELVSTLSVIVANYVAAAQAADRAEIARLTKKVEEMEGMVAKAKEFVAVFGKDLA